MVLMPLRIDLFSSVRRVMVRTAFLALEVLATLILH
jgi:hypothetical protein